ncbi:hypothetical protein HNP36_000716 [Chryseobacterium shigense]|uniref:Uncharacterized protein n=1 Tax=Chryseobacterium shigense TaxID=297244 RepID=A0A841N3D8_9FLAO|nr:hypothetical protein [Chryseobacterium shigense]
MDKQVQQLKKLINENLHRSKSQILSVFGKPSKKSDCEIWFYRKFYISFFNDEIAFLFEEDTVVDICITRYFLWKEVKSIYYFEGKNPEYKVVSLLIPGRYKRT